MRSYMLISKTRKIAGMAGRLVRLTALDAVLGAVCGALYGIVFGGFGALVRDQSSQMFWTGGKCAVAGFAIGLFVGLAQAALERLKERTAEFSSTDGGRDVLRMCAAASPVTRASHESQSVPTTAPVQAKEPVRAIAG